MTNKANEAGRKIARNTIYGFSSWFLPLALSFVATPVIVRALGNEDYGIYALVLGFIAYSFNFNVGRAITKYIAEYRVSGESAKIREVVSATIFVNVVVGLIGLLAIVLLSRWLAVDVLNIPPESQEKSIDALYVSGLTIFFVMVNQVFNAVLQGLHRFDVYAKIHVLNNVLLIGGNLVLAAKGFGLLWLLLWNLLVTVFAAIFSAIAAKRLLPEFPIALRFQRATLKLVFGHSSWIVAYQILANVLLLFERSWIARNLGAENLTFYVVPMMLALYIQSFIGSLMLVVFPMASELRFEPAKLLMLYQKATKIVCFLAFYLAATLIVQSRPFLTLWLGPEFAERSSGLLVLHTLTFGLLALCVVAWQTTEGLGFPNYNFYFFVGCFVISILGMVLLLPGFGNIGVAVARLAGFGSLFVWVFVVEKRFFGHVQSRFWLRLIGILTVPTALAVLTQLLFAASLSPSWFLLLFSAAAGGAVYCLTAWLLGLISDDEIAIFKRLARLGN